MREQSYELKDITTHTVNTTGTTLELDNSCCYIQVKSGQLLFRRAGTNDAFWDLTASPLGHLSLDKIEFKSGADNAVFNILELKGV